MMKKYFYLAALSICCDAFAPAAFSPTPHRRSRATSHVANAATSAVDTQIKNKFLASLDRPYDLNTRSETRTQLLNDVIENQGGLSNPGSQKSFATVAPGMWRVCYAPHMTIMAGLFQGEFSVQYDLRKDGTTTSHARYKFPLFNLFGYLSVSGTYGSVNNQVCRVDFNEAWIRTCDNDSFEQEPYPDIESVPDSIAKSLIRNIGKALFIEPFAVFPVSHLCDELIVFDFEVLGTRICARKES